MQFPQPHPATPMIWVDHPGRAGEEIVVEGVIICFPECGAMAVTVNGQPVDKDFNIDQRGRFSMLIPVPDISLARIVVTHFTPENAVFRGEPIAIVGPTEAPLNPQQ